MRRIWVFVLVLVVGFGPVAAAEEVLCMQFVGFCDAVEVEMVGRGNTIVAHWFNYDCGGAEGPMLGVFDPEKRSARLAGDDGSGRGVFWFDIDLKSGTGDLWLYDPSLVLGIFWNDQPVDTYFGACVLPTNGEERHPAFPLD